MKKFIFPAAILGFSCTLLSFSTNDTRKADFNELQENDSKLIEAVGSFTRIEAHHYTSDQGTWSRRVSVYTLTDRNAELDQIEATLN